MKCHRHGILNEGEYYIWKSKGKEKRACKQCARDKSKKEYEISINRYASKDYIGQVFNDLTFIKPTENRRRNRVLWKLRCVCGNETFKVAADVIRGVTKSCGCKTSKLRAEAGRKSRKLDPKISSARSIWRRVYNDGCDFETFLILSQQSCVYCGTPPCRTFNIYDLDKRHPKRDEANFTYNGLDRLDNSKGHLPNNIVPCCTNCNTMKMSLSVDEFINHIKQIYLHQKSCDEDRRDAGCL
jgi:hypothetical protein